MRCEANSHHLEPSSIDRKPYLSEDYKTMPGSHPDEMLALTGGLKDRRQSNEGEPQARDHELYKTATTGDDGLFHCPFEGNPDCNHKPEKLKCNYE